VTSFRESSSAAIKNEYQELSPARSTLIQFGAACISAVTS
jgi:hypothetical protein